MEKIIVKVQVPIYSTEDTVDVLVYNEDGSVTATFSLSPEEAEMLKSQMDDPFKSFFYASISKDKTLVLESLAPYQSW